jgi:ATP phosphoribosyltransferase regulatory subunit
MDEERWLLPSGIEEILPPQADVMESLRRALLDLYRTWGYELVIPPFIDYLESLLTGTGRDLELQTFKLIDQESGRLLGLRADMTPQVARIDAHQLRRSVPTRLCYLGTVLHTRSDGFAGTRSPLQIGAEIYGHAGPESDVEILRLVMETLRLAHIPNAYLDLGHVGIFRGLARQAGLDVSQEMAFFEVLQRKALPEIEDLIAQFGVRGTPADMLLALAELNGDDALDRAEGVLARAEEPVRAALNCTGSPRSFGTGCRACRCISTWRSCAAITTRPGSCLPRSHRAGDRRSLAAGVMTILAGSSDTRARRLDSARI